MKNLILRTITGIAFVAVLVGAIVYSPFTFGALFAVVSALSTLEFCKIVNQQEGVHTNPFICVLSSILLYFAFFAYSCGYANMLIIPATVFLLWSTFWLAICIHVARALLLHGHIP